MVKLLCNVPEKMVRTTFSEILHGVLAEAADKNFLTFPKEQENKTYTYRAFAERLTFLNSLYPVQQLKGRQIVILDTRREYVVFWLCAAMAYGAVAVPMNGAQPKNELGELIATLEPLAIVVPEGELQEWKSVLPENAADRLVASEEVERAELSGEIPPVGLASPEDTAVIIFTSGTTGDQKGAMIDHANLFGNMIPTADCYKYVYAPIKIYSILPYYHVFGITIDLLIVLMSGSELYLGKISNHLPAEIKKNGCTVMPAVPMLFDFFRQLLSQTLAAHKEMTPKQVKAALLGEQFHYMAIGGAYLEPEKLEQVETFGITVHQGYGMTECTSLISGEAFAGRREGSLGHLNPWIEYRIIDGEIQVRGAGVMSGYWKQPEETAKVLKDGWLCTGDLGEVDEDGFFFFKGRKKNILIAENGENVSPEPIETELMQRLDAKEVRIRLGKGGLQADLSFEGQLNPALPSLLSDYNRDKPMFRQVRSYSIYPDGLDKNAVGKIIREEGKMLERERNYV